MGDVVGFQLVEAINSKRWTLLRFSVNLALAASERLCITTDDMWFRPPYEAGHGTSFSDH
ncbi:hypothetical protein M404DRAFT_1007449 [Pisolithus tinctorius Marx 270]|uniref:Uncharacterized protein n=1 Tax=Pisolithus tinctorius Marx 270 TaxID=870435 RepID=A0A0C3JCS6_PISTI|nr:hypothetical protein M404DRAFT_1007449 [Pisolithus tinctorius Marx 270]